jgi:hypothetical protein
MSHATLAEARAAKARALELIQRLAPDAAVGITRVGESYAVKVNLARALPAEADLPTHIDGVPVRVEVVGEIRPR